MKLRKAAPFAASILLIAGFAFVARAPAQNVGAPGAGEPEFVAATFASAWCSSCKVLKPKLAKIIPAFATEPVAFVEFDFTFGPGDEVKAEAERYGLADIYERNKGATGFTLLVDADTGEIVDTLTMNFSEGAMKSAIARAVAVAAYTEQPAADAPAP